MPRSSLLLLAGALAALPAFSAALPASLAAQGATATRTATDAARESSRPAAEPRGASSTPSDPDLARAYSLVIDGKGKSGRAIVDSLLAAAPAGSARYAEVLYWRAAFAATTADAERDYRQLSVEYPLSDRAADALIALAQLEYVRNDTTLAVHHLQRLMIEHPAGVRSAKANFWAAGVLFDAGDPVRGCSALRAARATTGEGEGELRNQIEAEVPRCGAGARAGAVGAAPPTAARAPEAATKRPAAAKRAAPAKTPTKAAAASKPGRTARSAKPAAAGASAAPARATFAVQVAAYRSKGEAQALAAKLSGRGFAARVSGDAAPYRVQVGRYATRAQAVAARDRMKAAKLNGFVVERGVR